MPTRPALPHAAAMVGAALVASCGGPTQPLRVASCEERLSSTATPLGPAPGAEVPVSLVVVEASASAEGVAAALDRRVPRSVRAEGVDAGIAGEVSYSARRGPFTVGVEGRALRVAARVDAEMSLCKRVGPLCVGLGRCTPAYDVRATAPLTLDARWRLPAPRLAATRLAGCRLDALRADVSSEVDAQVQAALARQERELAARIPEPGASVTLAWKVLQTPIALTAEDCARLRPVRVLQAPPRLEEGRLALRVGLEARLGVAPCSGQAASSPVVPSPAPAEALPRESHLRLSMAAPWTTVSAELSRALVGQAGAGWRVVGVTARGARAAGHAVVALELLLDGQVCGPLVMVAEPWFDSSRERVRFRRVRTLADDDAGRRFERQLAPLVERIAEARVPIGPEELRRATLARLEEVRGALPHGLTLNATAPAVSAQDVTATAEGLVVEAVLAAELGLAWGGER